MSTPDERPSGRHRSAARRLRTSIAFAAVVVGSTGCFVGERPTLRDEPIVDDPAARSVYDRLAVASSSEFVATYRLTPTGSADEATATVTVGPGGYRVRVAGVDFVVESGSARTCLASTGECVDDLDDARISDLNVTHRFWGDAFRTRLGLDASRRVGFTEGSDETIAGREASCVDITIPSSVDASGTVRYCALDDGPLARYVGADVVIELIEFVPIVGG